MTHIKDVRLNKLTISELTIVVSNDNLKANWASYYISRPKVKSYPRLYFCILFVLIVFVFIRCDGNRAKHDLENAIKIGQALNKSNSSSNVPISTEPPNNQEDESTDVHTHTLKPGENVQDLAVLYDTDWQSILKANGIENPEELKPGQKILIPTKKSRQ